LTRNIRNLNKKISSSAKADTVVAENPGIALDDLVAQKKLNADQKAQILKKPALQAQLSQLEDQLSAFRTFAHELEEKAAKEKSISLEAHKAEIAQVKEEVAQEIESAKAKAVDDGLRVIVSFLHGAAAMRQAEDQTSDEARAYEGALLQIYQGNDGALATLKNLVYGTEAKVIDTTDTPLNFTFAQVKESSLQNAQGLSPASAAPAEDEAAPPVNELSAAPETGPDSTVVNAGLTELDDATAIQTNAGAAEMEANADTTSSIPAQISTQDQAANAVAGNWDPSASLVTESSTMNEEWVQVPRDLAETETGAAATPAAGIQSSNSWAEEVATSAEEKPVAENDGFEQVKRDRGDRGGRGRGRGGNRGRGENRSRGGGRGRGDGHRGGGAPRAQNNKS
jgi:uncharacterized membrane protein YgcG